MPAFLEQRALPCVIVARRTTTLKRKCAWIQEWTVTDEHHAAGESTAILDGLNGASPKLIPSLDRLAIGGGMI